MRTVGHGRIGPCHKFTTFVSFGIEPGVLRRPKMYSLVQFGRFWRGDPQRPYMEIHDNAEALISSNKRSDNRGGRKRRSQSSCLCLDPCPFLFLLYCEERCPCVFPNHVQLDLIYYVSLHTFYNKYLSSKMAAASLLTATLPSSYTR